MSETDCSIISSRGLLKSCDHHNKNPISSHRHIDPDILDNLKDGDTVYVCSWLTITKFVKEFVPKLTARIIVVSGDSDMDAPIFLKPVGPGDDIAIKEIQEFIDSPLCIHWYTQNCTLKHPKVSPIPIGLDYHSAANVSSPLDQEKEILSIAAGAKPFWERKIKCYGNYHFNVYHKYYTSERIDCFKQVMFPLVDYEQSPVSRTSTWNKSTEYAFVLSPAGMGLDCHRTWESIVLGCIPIIRRMGDPYEDLFLDLPVLLVDKWSDITPELLQKTIIDFKDKTQAQQFNMEKLKLSYWVNLIKRTH
jgi:hypothetical protein